MSFDVHHADSEQMLAEMEANSVTSIITDPPYGLEFMSKGWDKVLPPIAIWEQALRVAKPGAMLLAFGGTRTFHRLTCSIEDAGWEVRDCLMWLYGSGFPKSLDVSKAIDKVRGAEREVLATIPDRWAGKGQVLQRSTQAEAESVNITTPATDLAKKFEGYGTALKPAWEPIVLAMKPTDGTFADNAETHGVAGVNVDACRVGENGGTRAPGAPNLLNKVYGRGKSGGGCELIDKGRWPSNVVLDRRAAAKLDAQTGELRSGALSPKQQERGGFKGAKSCYGSAKRGGSKAFKASKGGASRFFYTGKASKYDRERGGRVENNHPTVKPTELMRWLVRLVSPPEGGVVLDPFCGSGSTGVACAIEGAHFVGIERDEDSATVARQRIQAVLDDLEAEKSKA